MKKFLGFMIILIGCNSYAQEYEIGEKGYDLLQDNLMMYRIKNDLQFLNDENSNSLEYQFDSYILREGEVFDVSLLNYVHLNYPNPSFKLFIGSNYHYSKRIKGEEKSVKVATTHATFPFSTDHRLLIGYNEKEDKLLFISGPFFKSNIKKDFELDIKRPKTFEFFLKFKLFNYKPEKITFVKKRRKYLLFEVYSDLIKRDILVKVMIEDFDKLEIMSK